MCMSERGITSKAEETPESMGDSMTLLLLNDFWHKFIWTYPVEGKGVTKAEWFPHRINE